MNERNAALRAMAAHRGLTLVASRRRKPGGDFGLYGLRDAAGAAVFGIEGEALTADGDAVEAWLRDATRQTWGESAESVGGETPRASPKPKPKPKPRPKPRFKVSMSNVLDALPAATRGEAFTELLARPGVRIERIVSHGQATPEDAPMVQDNDEWVLLLQGAAGLRIEDSDEVTLAPGDALWIARGQKHWVTWTAKDRPSIWLAVHFD